MKEFIKNTIILILFLFVVSAIFGGDLSTTKGITYKDYEILTVTDACITITHEGGAAEVELKELPEELLKTLQPQISEYKNRLVQNVPKRKLRNATSLIVKEPPISSTVKVTTPPKPPTLSPAETEELKEAKEVVSFKEKEIAKAKETLKNIDTEIRLKDTFKSEVNTTRVEDLKRQKVKVEGMLKNLQIENRIDQSRLNALTRK